MKKNQMDVMRKARNNALTYEPGIHFKTFHVIDPDKYNSALQTPQSRKHKGSITVAYKQIPPDIAQKELAKIWQLSHWLTSEEKIFIQPKTRYFRIGCSFCSPKEKNPSRIFGEGLAVLRLHSDKAHVFILEEGMAFSINLGEYIIILAAHRLVPWMKNINAKDLV